MLRVDQFAICGLQTQAGSDVKGPRPLGHLPCNEDVLAEGLHGVHVAVVEGRVHHILMKKYVEMDQAFKTAAARGGENL